MVPGKKMTLRGREFIVPPLDLDAVERFTEDGTFKAISTVGTDGLPTKEQSRAARAIVHAALSVNYPEIKLEEMGHYLDMQNTAEVVKVITGRTRLEEATGE